MSIIKLKNVSKFYRNKNTISSGFNKINLELDMGEFVTITGESGSGKSTLLNVISGLDSYEEGEMYINGEETSHYTEVDYEEYRRKYIGNIFQHFNLVNSYTVYQNVELVLLLNGYKKKEIKKKILDILKTVGLTKYKNTKASKLSGGQKQRVAIARALAKDTPIIVADEPTGNLDVQSAKSIMKLLKDISQNKLVVIVTHNYEQVEEYTTRKISMHDGKIIEDKRIAPYQKCLPVEVAYKDLTKENKLMLGFRNAFNIKTKFLLLFFIYFFLTFVVFSEYSSLKKSDFDASLEGYNNYFMDRSVNRVVLKKNDKTIFTKDDILKLESSPNIKSTFKDDLLLDLTVSTQDQEIYMSGTIKPLSTLDDVDAGSMAKEKNEVVIMGSPDSYYFLFYDKDLINREMNLVIDKNNISLGKIKTTGLKYSEEDKCVFYVSDEILEEARLNLIATYSKTDLSIDNETFSQEDDSRIYYNIEPSNRVEKGSAYIFNELNMYCKDFSCLNKKIELNVENMYYKDSLSLTVKNTITKENVKNLLGITLEETANKIYINIDDYKSLYDKGNYQVSIFLDDVKKSDETIRNLQNEGYITYSLKDNLVNPSAEISGLIRMMRTIVFAIATGTLFFIAYVIIKIILKSRNIYFSTIRILGATKKIACDLLNIELLIDIHLAYLLFAIFTIFVKSGFVNNAYIMDMVKFFTLKDYLIIYVILIIMSLIISNRYSHKLFKSSAMSTYREEV